MFRSPVASLYQSDLPALNNEDVDIPTKARTFRSGDLLSDSNSDTPISDIDLLEDDVFEENAPRTLNEIENLYLQQHQCIINHNCNQNVLFHAEKNSLIKSTFAAGTSLQKTFFYYFKDVKQHFYKNMVSQSKYGEELVQHDLSYIMMIINKEHELLNSFYHHICSIHDAVEELAQNEDREKISQGISAPQSDISEAMQLLTSCEMLKDDVIGMIYRLGDKRENCIAFSQVQFTNAGIIEQGRLANVIRQSNNN